MSISHRYKKRDYTFGLLLVTLREKTGFTQSSVAAQTGVTEKALRNWESGSNYPSEIHLKTLIEFYLGKGAFVPGKEREEASMLWKQMTQNAFRRKANFDDDWFAGILQAYVRQEQSDREPEDRTQVATTSTAAGYHRRDWEEQFDLSTFYGRDQELAELERWVLTDQCRVVTLLGMGGIGKTVLALAFMHRVVSHFQHVFWKSLKNAPLLDDVLADLLLRLAEQQHLQMPALIEERITMLLELLHTRRCLLVLDNIESVLLAGSSDGRYREGYEGYGLLIERLVQTSHISCVLLTGREKPVEVEMLEGASAYVHTLQVKGLNPQASQALLQKKGLLGNQAAWEGLVQVYAGNPLALKIVAGMVRDLFEGDIASFLQEGEILFNGIRHLLHQQFERLSALEQELLYWLAIDLEPVTLNELCAHIEKKIPRREILDALYALCRRSLLEKGERAGLFTLRPIVLEYVIERLVEQVSTEIDHKSSLAIANYALMSAQAKEYVRHCQRRLILQPVLDRLFGMYQSKQLIEDQLLFLLNALGAKPLCEQGYAGGNIRNLLACLKGNVREIDYWCIRPVGGEGPS